MSQANFIGVWMMACLPGTLLATNGDTVIGVGPSSRSMGGVAIASLHGAESVTSNPAVITGADHDEYFIAVTAFMPDVEADVGAGYTGSDSRFNTIPAFGVLQHENNTVSWGVGMFGTAGMGVDYRKSAAHMHMATNLQLMQFIAPLAYRYGRFSIGFAPVLQYGALDITYTNSTTTGMSEDYGFGFNIGAAYHADAITVGILYKSPIDMEYDGQLSNATTDFGLSGYSDHLEQPYELGIGISYAMDVHRAAFDFKKIGWSASEGYRDFGWDDQTVYAFGYEYSETHYRLRMGFNHAESPIRQGVPVVNVLNLLGFPAIVQTHYTAGFTVDLTETLHLNVAYTYAPETGERYPGLGADVRSRHSQQAVTLGAVFR